MTVVTSQCDLLACQRRAVIKHIARYRIAVVATLQQLPEFATCTRKEMRHVLRLIEAEGIIESQWLHHDMPCWHLADKGTIQSGLPTERGGPLSESAKLRAYAMLRFCCLSKRPRMRLTADDIQEHFPDLYRTGMPQGYYFDSHGEGTLGLLRIDAGGRGRWDRVVHSVLDDVDQHRQQAAFSRLIQAHRFEFAIATVLPQKAGRICEVIEQKSELTNVAIRVVAIPELLPLIASTSGKEVRP
jgi:hypothetical protein